MHNNDSSALSPSHDYVFTQPVTAHQVLEKATELLAERYLRQGEFFQAEDTKHYLQHKLGVYEREVFAVLLLDSQHRLIAYRELFQGTIDCANVYPREVVKVALQANAAAVIMAHNHPSGSPEPSQSDKIITRRLVEALALVDVRVLDHIVVGETATSFAQRGLL
ncbi:MAG: DNA repair protein RadC [Pseudomonadales bacterium]|nr:DNA repair protein RadC [Pseudomonadales bacterium]